MEKLSLIDRNNNVTVFPSKDEAKIYACKLMKDDSEILYCNINESISYKYGSIWTIDPIYFNNETLKMSGLEQEKPADLVVPSQSVMIEIVKDLEEAKAAMTAEEEQTAKIIKPEEFMSNK